mgnify:CR=1 FL=1
MRNVFTYFMLFFIYAILGWIIETTLVSIEKRKFVNRGFLIGPYCPIYGFGGLAITILLKNYTKDPIVLFLMAVIICGTLEYFTSYIMEKIFKARWWDYSQRRFNINGRICLETLIPFGIAGTFILYIANPFIMKYINMIPELGLHIFTVVFLLIYVTDMIVSFKIILNLKEMTKEFKDNTIEISTKVKKIIRKKLFLYRRLARAFPKIQNNILYDKWDEMKKKIEESKEEIALKIDNSKREIRNRIDSSKQNFRK